MKYVIYRTLLASLLMFTRVVIARDVPPRIPSPELLAQCERLLQDASRVQSKTDRFMDHANPFALVLNRVLGVSHRRLAPPSFFLPSEKGLVLGINGVSRHQAYHHVGDYLSGSEFQVDEFVLQDRAMSPRHLVDQLLEYRRRFGPIFKLVLVAHGLPGQLNIGGTMLSEYSMMRMEYVLRALPHDLFAKNAIIVLLSCSSAHTAHASFFGDDGHDQLGSIFRLLARQGAKVIASTRYVDPELAHIPAHYATLEDRLKRHLLTSTLGSLYFAWEMLTSNQRGWAERVVEIDLAPVAP